MPYPTIHKRVFITCLLGLYGSLLLANARLPAVAAEPRRGVLLQAETVEYSQQTQRRVATGKVRLVYGTTRLFAERLELNTASGVGLATGRVLLRTPEDEIYASHITFELAAERVMLYQATGTVAQKYQVSGERIVRRGPRMLEIERGRVTTCKQAVPDWEFRARNARLGPGDYVTLRHPSFWVKGIPVFYLPYFFLPLQDKRTTGFLPPHIGVSRRDGAIVGTAFYWAPRDWLDATVGLEYLSATGWKPIAEVRYALDPLSDGQLRGSFIHEQDTGTNRWKVFVQQRQEFGWGVRGVSQLDLRSRRDIDRRFSRQLALEARVQTDSFAALSKRFANGILLLSGGQSEEILEGGSRQRYRRAPRLSWTQFPVSLFGLAFLTTEASYNRLQDTAILADTPVQRLDLFPRLLLPVTFAPWLRLTLTGGIRGTFYDHTFPAGGSAERGLVDLRAHVEGPTWQRRFAAAQATRGMIHLITIRLAYRYVPMVQQDDLPGFDTLDTAQHFLDPLETLTFVDRILPANYAKLSLVQRFFAWGGSRAPIRPLGRLVISQGLDLRATTGSDASLIGPLDLEAEMYLGKRWTLATTVRLLPASGVLEEANGRLRLRLLPGLSVHAASRYRQDPDILYAAGGIQVTLWRQLQIGYDWRFDGQRGILREQQVMLRYATQCWNVAMRFRLQEQGDTLLTLQVALLHL